jgi:hypothetical protein
LHAARQLIRIGVFEAEKPNHVDELPCLALALLSFNSSSQEGKLYILLQGQPGKKVVILSDVSDLLVNALD